jgi:hypothetical protein
MKDEYGSVLRESLKKSMEQPAKFRPFTRKDDATNFIRTERRRRWLRRLWWHNSEWIKTCSLIVAWFGVCVGLWFLLNKTLGVFR